MSKQLKDCIPILEVFVKLDDPVKKRKYLKMFENCIFKAVREMAVNLLQGNVDLTPGEKSKLKRYKMALRSLADGQTPLNSKRKILQGKGKQLINQLLPLTLSTING